jgi:chemotaxis signal transduction protein
VEEIVIPQKDEIIEPDEFQKDLNESFIWKLFRHNEGVVIVIDPSEIVNKTHLNIEGSNLAQKLNGEIVGV